MTTLMVNFFTHLFSEHQNHINCLAKTHFFSLNNHTIFLYYTEQFVLKKATFKNRNNLLLTEQLKLKCIFHFLFSLQSVTDRVLCATPVTDRALRASPVVTDPEPGKG